MDGRSAAGVRAHVEGAAAGVKVHCTDAASGDAALAAKGIPDCLALSVFRGGRPSEARAQVGIEAGHHSKDPINGRFGDCVGVLAHVGEGAGGRLVVWQIGCGGALGAGREVCNTFSFRAALSIALRSVSVKGFVHSQAEVCAQKSPTSLTSPRLQRRRGGKPIVFFPVVAMVSINTSGSAKPSVVFLKYVEARLRAD